MSLGEELKRLREAKGLSIEELADATHIGPHVLLELEAGDYSRLSAAIYGSGFVKILAKFHNIDAAPLRDTFMREYQAFAQGRDAMPKPKAEPLKFNAERIVKPEPKAEAKPEIKRAAAPAVAPAAAPAAPAPAEEAPLGDLFGEIKHVAEQPARRDEEIPPQPQETIQPPRQEPAKEEFDEPLDEPIDDTPGDGKGAGSFDVRPAMRQAATSFLAHAGKVLRNPTFQRICVAAVILMLAAWACALFVGGGKTGEPTIAATTEEPAVAPPVAAEPPAPEVPATVEPEPPVMQLIGNALTDNLLPPPDCYAE